MRRPRASGLRPQEIGAVLLLVVTLACARDVGQEEWQAMSRDEKTLYVHSLIGAEKTRERKGGSAIPIEARPEEIVARVDVAYARGDQRSVSEIFSTLAGRRDSPPLPPPASP